MKEENLKTIYKETVELHKYQQQSLDLLYNKLNWILVSDVVFLASLYSTGHPNVLIIFLVSLSAAFTLSGFSPKGFKYTRKISDQLIDVDRDNFLEILISKKAEAFEKNVGRSKELKIILGFSQWLLIAAIFLQFLILFINQAYVGR